MHGGCKTTNSSLSEEPKVAQRQRLSLPQKQLIAQYAVTLVQDNEVIFLDSGTTVQKMIPELTHLKYLLVVTNSVDNGSLLADFQIRTIVLGGSLRALTKATVGANVLTYLNNCHLDRAFMGTNGFDSVHGYTTPDPDESAVKSLVIRQADQAYILADSSKYQQTRFSKFAELADADLITDHLTTAAYQQLRHYTKIMEVKK
ncbi:DeoR/GlpR transcriptional regulator [Lactobacillus sp. XV13L]|nr:DeoR/GlpR transcriptional regulator [Lactobacillus sp. XV13L]